MEYLDATELTSKELNVRLVSALKMGAAVTVENPHAMHNIGTGLNLPGKVFVKGSTGFYVGGFLEGTTIEVDGNAGWYAGDNMMDGELLIAKNAGCNAGTYFNGGTMVIYGSVGSRAGYGMKNGTIIVCGNAGRWAGQMTTGGQLIILGAVGKQIGESMYKGVIYAQDPEVAAKLGGNVRLDNLSAMEREKLQKLFAHYAIAVQPGNFRAIRPLVSGRHTYTLFRPELHPELSNKYHADIRAGAPNSPPPPAANQAFNPKENEV
ncbi:MAG: glutamate synthase [Bacillota bacterium]|jgi:glutamate synthase domain-containing protein 3